MRWFVASLLLLGLAFAKGLSECMPPGALMYTQDVTRAAAEFGIPPELLAGLVVVESHYDPVAVNGEVNQPVPVPVVTAGQRSQRWTPRLLGADYGLAQIRGITAWDLGAHYAPWQLFEPLLNLRLGAKLLGRLYARFGTWDQAIAAYNGGTLAGKMALTSSAQNPVYVKKVFANWDQIVACERHP